MDGSIMSAEQSVWVGAQVEGRLILLICESCQRPLEDESVSGRVTYSYSVHAEGGLEFRAGGLGVMESYREHLFPEIS